MYDSLSGMTIKQWSVPAHLPSAQGSLDWSRAAPLKYQEPRGGRVRPLVDIAIRTLAKNIGLVSKEHLEALPAHILGRLWLFLEARGGACLHAWKIFSELLMTGEQNDPALDLYRFRQHLCHPEEELKLYIQPLNSASVDFISHIIISGNCIFQGNELLALADMKNLGVLELIKPADGIFASFPQVNDRIIRGWSEAVDPFPLLRVLKIWGDQTVTEVSLRWAAKFPSLVLYDVIAGKDGWTSACEEAKATGWTVSQQIARSEDMSILRYLMLFAPSEDMAMKRFFDLSRSIDDDLINLSRDARCVLKHVSYNEAPPLLDCLMDSAKVSVIQPDISRKAVPTETQFCHEAAFEAWAFWLYSLIGQLSGDRDMESRGIGPKQQTVAGPFVLPSKPMACLFLGHIGHGGITSKPSYISRGLFATKRFTFTRLEILKGIIPPNTRLAAGAANSEIAPKRQASVKHNKRKRIEDVLGSFG
ncbi:hypothetical protein NHJ6243_007072 [Beauveria neobassiana]